MGNIINCEEQVKDDDEENKCFDIITIMGNTVVGGGSNGAKSSKRNIEKKIEQASKTGVLNLVGMVSVFLILSNSKLLLTNFFNYSH